MIRLKSLFEAATYKIPGGPELRFEKVPGAGNKVAVTNSVSGKKYIYNIWVKGMFSDEPLNFKDIREAGGNIVIDRWISGGKTNPELIDVDAINKIAPNLRYGKPVTYKIIEFRI
jgi:hypothetical protein